MAIKFSFSCKWMGNWEKRHPPKKGSHPPIFELLQFLHSYGLHSDFNGTEDFELLNLHSPFLKYALFVCSSSDFIMGVFCSTLACVTWPFKNVVASHNLHSPHRIYTLFHDGTHSFKWQVLQPTPPLTLITSTYFHLTFFTSNSVVCSFIHTDCTCTS